MPELPEVERTRLTLASALADVRITRVRLHRPDVVTGSTRPRDLLVGAQGITTHRHGKQFALESEDGRVLLAHLGMTGNFCVQDHVRSADLPAHSHVVWSLEHSDGRKSILRFTDARRFGGLWTLPDTATLRQRHWNSLGPDALTITPTALRTSLRGTERAIKACLLDQRVIAGVGNIYADEALFLAGIHPATRASEIDAQDLKRLVGRLKTVLRCSIRAGGSTLRDYRDGAGNAGGFQHRHRVYGRGGEACLTCKKTLQMGQIAQRTTVWCPSCQSP